MKICQTTKNNFINKKSIFLAIVFLLLMISTFSFAQELPTWNGSSAAAGVDYSINGNNYIIKTPLGLAWALSGEAIKSQLDKGYQGKTIILENDIDMSAAKFPNVVANGFQFKGTFDGNGKTLTGIRGENFNGLFNYNTDLGVIKNLNISLDQDLFNNSSDYHAIIVGGDNKGTIKNCFVNGNGFSTNFAGICARNYGDKKTAGIISECGVYNLTIKDYPDNIGGLVCQNAGIVNNCLAVDISFEFAAKNSYTGGIVGLNSGKVTNSYAVISVTGVSYTWQGFGAITGSGNQNQITNCYYNAYNTTSNYAIKDTNGTGGSVNRSRTIDYMKTQGFVDLLNSNQAETFWQKTDGFPNYGSITPTWDGSLAVSGTDYVIVDDTVTIKTPLGLAWIAYATNNNILVNGVAINGFKDKTIELTENFIYNLSGGNWIPIGNNTSTAFNGTFNGSDATVTGLSNNTEAPFALFGYLSDDATVKNLNYLVSSDVNALSDWASIAYENKGTIENIRVYQEPTSSYVITSEAYAYIGGIVARNLGTVTHSYTENLRFARNGNIIGGIAAINNVNDSTSNTGIISNCYVYNMYADITNASGSVSGIAAEQKGNIKNSYVTIDFSRDLNTGDEYNISALAGENQGTVVNTYYRELTNLIGIVDDSNNYSKSDDYMKSLLFVADLNLNNATAVWCIGDTIAYPQFTPTNIIAVEKAKDVNRRTRTSKNMLDDAKGKLIFLDKNSSELEGGSVIRKGDKITPNMKNKAEYVNLKRYLINGKRYDPATNPVITVDSISTQLTANIENTYQTALEDTICKYKSISTKDYVMGIEEYDASLSDAQTYYDVLGVNLTSDQYKDELLASVRNLKKLPYNLVTNASTNGTVSGSSGAIEAGTFATVVATPNAGCIFVNWTDTTNGNILSTNATFRFYLTRDMNITANFVTNKVKITFIDQFDKLIESTEATPNTTITAPGNVARPGYTFNYWLYNGTQYKNGTNSALNIPIGTSNANIIAYYTADAITYTVDVVGGTISSTVKTGYAYSEKVTVTANTPAESMKFAYWIDSKTGDILSFVDTYTFAVSNDTRLEAVFVDEDSVIVNAPSIKLDASPIINVAAAKISFVAKIDMDTFNTTDTSGNKLYTALEHGMLLYQGETSNLDMDNATTIIKSTKTNSYGQYSITKTNAAGQTWTGRAYLIYSDLNGAIHTIFSSNMPFGTVE